MKGHRRLNNITVRRKRKVSVHSLLSVIVMQAMALAFPDRPRCCAGEVEQLFYFGSVSFVFWVIPNQIEAGNIFEPPNPAIGIQG